MTSAAISPGISEQNKASVISVGGIVGCYFGARVCITYLFFRADPQAGTICEVLLNLILLLPVAFCAIGPATMPVRRMIRTTPVRFVLLFLTLSITSLLWSATQSKAAALAYWSALAADVLMVLMLLRTQPVSEAVAALMKGFVCGVCILAVVAWASPAMPDLRLGDDEFLNPNAIGFECAFAVMLCQYLGRSGQHWRWLGVALAVTLLRSLSKTSILAFLVGEALYLLRGNSVSRATKLRLGFGSLAVLAMFWSLFSSYYTVYTNAGNQAETLTGRTAIWIVALGFAWQQPWLGHGIHSFRAVMPAFDLFEPWHAHNELLQQFFAYGLVGVAVVAGLYGSFYRQLRRLNSSPLREMSMALLVIVLVRGLADTERFDLSFPLWAITAFSLALAQPLNMAEATI